MSQPSSARWWALGATALTLLVVGLDMTVLNVALPDIAADLGLGLVRLQVDHRRIEDVFADPDADADDAVAGSEREVAP